MNELYMLNDEEISIVRLSQLLVVTYICIYLYIYIYIYIYIY